MFSLCCSSSWMHTFCAWISLITPSKEEVGVGLGVDGLAGSSKNLDIVFA